MLNLAKKSVINQIVPADKYRVVIVVLRFPNMESLIDLATLGLSR